MEYLSRLLKDLQHEKSYKFHPRCRRMGITHLSFVDDLLLFTRGDSESVQRLNACFTTFSAAPGLQVNLTKSTVYCGGMAQREKEAIVQLLGYSLGELPFKYLGVPLDTKKLTMIWNNAAIAKTHWDLTHKQDKLWIKWIHAYYIKDQSLGTMNIPQTSSWMDRLLTVDRLLIWDLNVQAVCAMSQAHNETRNHLFAECRYAQAIWNRVSKWAQQQLYGGSNWELQFQEIVKSIQGKTTKAKLIKMIYAEVIYAIWKERMQEFLKWWPEIVKEWQKR
ncbi:uncharacterized protein [Nicotiana tomentosiformis]|uniref:uncharacterized protein n=1 Tax=Nicotiana tomentosiformis TaxID=4098 RepID=UPI00388CDDF4